MDAYHPCVHIDINMLCWHVSSLKVSPPCLHIFKVYPPCLHILKVNPPCLHILQIHVIRYGVSSMFTHCSGDQVFQVVRVFINICLSSIHACIICALFMHMHISMSIFTYLWAQIPLYTSHHSLMFIISGGNQPLRWSSSFHTVCVSICLHLSMDVEDPFLNVVFWKSYHMQNRREVKQQRKSWNTQTV